MSKHFQNEDNENNEQEQERKALQTLPKAMHNLMVDVENVVSDTERILIDVEEIEHSCNNCCLQCIWRHLVRVFCCSKDATDDDNDYNKFSEKLHV